MDLNPEELHIDLEGLSIRLGLKAGRPARWSRAGPPFLPLEKCGNRGLELDRHQAQAAAHYHGPMVVLAPAGSGKTRTLTARIASLVDCGIQPEGILALAFNRKAAREMEERLAQMAISKVRTRTFHSLGYEIIRQGMEWRYDADSETRYKSLVLAAVRQAWQARYQSLKAAQLAPFLASIERIKSDLLQLEEMSAQVGYGELPLQDLFRQVIERQQQARLLTFNDMIYQALRVLVRNSSLRRQWQENVKFLLVDEFQDLNTAQMLLVRILAHPHENLFVVGDDDQLIYGWRGARVTHILNFDAVFPGAGKVVLGTNYRSAKNIVRHAQWLISQNSERVDKKIRPRPGAPNGILEVQLSETQAQQAHSAASWIQEQQRRFGLRWADFGVLFRTNQEAEWLVKALQTQKIPFTAPTLEEDPQPGEADLDQVRLLTIHKAKGKEFPLVVYFNLSRSAGIGQTETEERRVAYVALTRAMQGLLITGQAGSPSRFLQELAFDPKLSDFALPYLERRLRILLRRRLAAALGGGFSGWLRAEFAVWTGRINPESHHNDEPIDRLETEIRLRKSLQTGPGI